VSVQQWTNGNPPALAVKASQRDPLIVLAGAALSLVVVFALVGVFWTPWGPDEIFTADPLSPPSWSHPFGTDDLGRDIFSRVLRGSASSLLAPIAVVLGATMVGATIGMLAAWFGGMGDWLLTRVIDVIFAIPGLVLAVLAVAMFGKGLAAPIVALAIAYVPIAARLIRTTVQVELGKPYMEALHVQGVGPPAFWFRHLVPALLPLLLAQMTVAFGYAMIDLAAISFLGLGQQPPAADWGVLVASGQASVLNGHPEQSLFPSLLILVTVVAVSLLGSRATAWAERRDR